jgi:hypothetical protein
MKPSKLDPAIENILADLQSEWQTNQAETTKTIAQTWSEVDAEWETMLNQVKPVTSDAEESLAEPDAPEFDWSINDLAQEFDPINGGPAYHFVTWDTGEFPAIDVELSFEDKRPTDNDTPTPWADNTPLPQNATRPIPVTPDGFDPLDLLQIEVEEPITEDNDGIPITVNLAELLKGNTKPQPKVSGDLKLAFDWSMDDLAPGVDSIEGGTDDQFLAPWDTAEFPCLELYFADGRPNNAHTPTSWAYDTPLPPTPWAYDTPLPPTATRPITAIFSGLKEDEPTDESVLSFEADEFPSGDTPVHRRNSGTFTRLSPDLNAYYQLAAERLGEKPPKPTMTNSAPALFSKPPTIGDQSLASRAKEGAKALWGKVRSWF